MSAIFFEKQVAKKHKFFLFLEGCYYVIGGPIDMMFAYFERLPRAF